ncbi:MAG: hypothetical protein AB1633_06930 [Elusimicrobiota bacterium]
MKKRKTLQEKALIALKEAVRDVIIRHKQTGRPLVLWKNGRVVKVSAEKLLLKTK